MQFVSSKPRFNSSRRGAEKAILRPQESIERTKMDDQRARVVRCIRTLPAGMVSSYGAIAKAAGWPGAARQVARTLQQVQGLPWYRVVGAGGALKLKGEQGAEQKFRLQMEGVTFRGSRVNMKKYEYLFKKTKRPK